MSESPPPRPDATGSAPVIDVTSPPTGNALIRVLILGVGKSGTTALMTAVSQALGIPYRMEPKRLGELDYGTSFVAKKLVDTLTAGEMRCITRFDKVIFLIRDPRDIMISRLMYRPYGLKAFRKDVLVKRYLDAVERKRSDPAGVSVCNVIDALQTITGYQTIAIALGTNAKLLDLYRSHGTGAVLVKYEDFIAGRTHGLEAYIGAPLSAMFEVEDKYRRVSRRGGAGDWKNWFTAADQIRFDDAFTESLAFFDYPVERLPARQRIDRRDSVDYVRRIIDEWRTQRGLPLYDPRPIKIREARARRKALRKRVRKALRRRIQRLGGFFAPGAESGHGTTPVGLGKTRVVPGEAQRPAGAGAAASQQVCFITGVGRSGTTAMADLLNLHPDVCIGMERYKFKFLRAEKFDAADFTPQRFFDFHAGDTNLLPTARGRWGAVYAAMAPKYPQARLVGDKIPHLFERFEPCAAVFPQARWIYMLRDVQAVAASWDARARNPRDRWAPGNDHRAAVQVWNRANALVTGLPEDRVKVVHYEAFFGGSARERRALLDFLDLPEHPAFAAAAQASCRKYADLRQRKRHDLPEDQRAHVAARADLAIYARLVARARPRGGLRDRLGSWFGWRPAPPAPRAARG